MELSGFDTYNRPEMNPLTCPVKPRSVQGNMLKEMGYKGSLRCVDLLYLCFRERIPAPFIVNL